MVLFVIVGRGDFNLISFFFLMLGFLKLWIKNGLKFWKNWLILYRLYFRIVNMYVLLYDRYVWCELRLFLFIVINEISFNCINEINFFYFIDIYFVSLLSDWYLRWFLLGLSVLIFVLLCWKDYKF